MPRRARAGEKIAVLVLATADKDAELADNLTEVIIAYAAQHGGFEVAGKEEFRARLGVENERRAQACLDDISASAAPACRWACAASSPAASARAASATSST